MDSIPAFLNIQNVSQRRKNTNWNGINCLNKCGDLNVYKTIIRIINTKFVQIGIITKEKLPLLTVS